MKRLEPENITREDIIFVLTDEKEILRQIQEQKAELFNSCLDKDKQILSIVLKGRDLTRESVARTNRQNEYLLSIIEMLEKEQQNAAKVSDNTFKKLVSRETAVWNIINAICLLPAEDQRLLKMLYREKYKWDYIVEKMDCSRATLFKKRNRALDSILSELKYMKENKSTG